MKIEEACGSIGDPAIAQIETIISISAGRSPEAVLEALDRYGIERYISGSGDLRIRCWQVATKGFVTREEVAEVRAMQPHPERADDLDWLSSNMDKLRRSYADQWIAIVEGQVVASASKLPELVKAIETVGIERPFVTFITDQEITWNMAYGEQGF